MSLGMGHFLRSPGTNLSYNTYDGRRSTKKQLRPRLHRPKCVLATPPILLHRETFLLLFAGIVYAGYYIVLTSLPQQLTSAYHFNSIQVGLCFLPIGLGPLLIRAVIGRIMDFNYRRHAKRLGVELVKNRQVDMKGFPVERARLEIILTLVYITAVVLFPYGWVINMHHPPLPAHFILLFIMGASLAAALQPIPALTIDLHPRSPAAATAVGRFIRCLLGAGGVALVNRLLENWSRDGLGRWSRVCWV